jgi:uncharacterized phage protein (TIGR02218 family)
MKRLMPSGLITWLSNNKNCLKADLFQINLSNGQTINATSGQWGITVPSGTPGWVNGGGSNLPTTTFHATDYGVWSRGEITSEGSFGLNANTMDLSAKFQQGTSFPGTTGGMLYAAWNGLFDAATVRVWTAYMPANGYGNVSNGIETKGQYTIGPIKDYNRTSVTFECGDPLYLLNLKVPTRIMAPSCQWSVGDGNCTLSLAGNDINGHAMTQAFTAASGTTQWTLEPATAFGQPTGYFTQGVVTCTSGTNGGLSQTVKLHDSSGHLEMMNPWLFTPNTGDTFSVIVGCDHTLPTCISKFGNSINYGGTDFVPPSNQGF